MAKIRIYELAKELGLSNKALLSLCEQLGIEGKSSHSNSLSDDEAEQIRRHVIRKTMGDGQGLVREVNKEGEILTERRVGNVIRRRKKDPAEEEAAAEEKKIDLNDAVPASSDSFGQASSQLDNRSEALAQADALFADTEVVAEESPQASEQEKEETVEESSPEVEEAAPEVSSTSEQESSSDKPKLERTNVSRGAKVLGKIDLPLAKPVKEEKEAAAATPSATAEAPARGDSRSVKKRKKPSGNAQEYDEFGLPVKKRKKKQVLRKDDLLDYEGDRENWKSRRDRKKKGSREDRKKTGTADAAPMKASKRVVKIDSEISVAELAKQMGLKATEVIACLMNLGTMATINQVVDIDTATVVASEFDFTILDTGKNVEAVVENLMEEDDPESLKLRPPVVTVMGHVDHGKTSLLDEIRKTTVSEGEAGGITQHIGAYNVATSSGGSVTFLDTPGHAAFTEMRSRGAKVTDIVVLVVAADDGVMPQTVEAINHAKAAEVPIIVAMNKIDKEEANPERIKQQLAEHELIPEDWGGDTIFAPVSAKTGQGLEDLLENLYLQAEILELKANPDRAASGTVVESKLDKSRGPVITVLVQKGTLRKGDAFLCGAVAGKVRALHLDGGIAVEEAGPSIPVEILGVSEPPMSGDDFVVLESESRARELAEQRINNERKSAGAGAPGALTLESFSEMMSQGELKDLPMIIKADVQGSVEAIAGALTGIEHDEVKVKIVHQGVGAISENDVQLAAASGAIMVGFNVRADSRASKEIEKQGVSVMYSRVIYELVDNVKKAMLGLVAPKFKEETLGRVEVRDTFRVPKLGMVAGSYVMDGTIKRGALVRLLRDNKIVFEGKMASLRRFKDDVKEVNAGYECGIGIEGYSDIKDGDIIEVYHMKEIEQTV